MVLLIATHLSKWASITEKLLLTNIYSRTQWTKSNVIVMTSVPRIPIFPKVYSMTISKRIKTNTVLLNNTSHMIQHDSTPDDPVVVFIIGLLWWTGWPIFRTLSSLVLISVLCNISKAFTLLPGNCCCWTIVISCNHSSYRNKMLGDVPGDAWVPKQYQTVSKDLSSSFPSVSPSTYSGKQTVS